MADGTAEQRTVLRVGTFSAYSNSDFLRYVPETGELLVLSRQPPAHYGRAVESFSARPGDVTSIPLDPSRGSLLGMLSYTPSLKERVDQGGSIALIIIGLGALGMLMALWRGAYLVLVTLRIKSQLGTVESPGASNPLGRVLLSVQGVSRGNALCSI